MKRKKGECIAKIFHVLEISRKDVNILEALKKRGITEEDLCDTLMYMEVHRDGKTKLPLRIKWLIRVIIETIEEIKLLTEDS